MPVVPLEAESISDLVGLVVGLAEAGDDGQLWFRGQGCERLPLRSKLARKVLDPDSLLVLEQRLITRFRQRSLPYWPTGYPQDDWEQLFAMQHHGIPTRLLDWTENLFIALYFATAEAQVDGGDDCMAVVWVLDPIGWNRQVPQLRDFADDVAILTTDSEDLAAYAPRTRHNLAKRRYNHPVAVYGTHNSSRIVAQRGTFTVAGNSLEPLESFTNDTGPDVLWRIALNFSRQSASKALKSLGFAESMIFPDLVGVGREITISEGLQ